ncbi:LacI family DNA-binding transcriptional regulator [Kineococcus sp. TBRC 1896]|uniref:LacI family DNA-binding transcriptional regulator n=1 Tax=Kineococcus mangrovi TaxID=1660183 RepID=A0ABV4HX06_9ACTN
MTGETVRTAGAAQAKRATIYEVATLAGVSHQTVSRYLRGNGGLRPDTSERVEAAIEQLNYRPNLVARSMRTRRTGRIALLVPSTTGLPLRLIAAAMSVAHDAGYAVDLIGREGARGGADHWQEVADSGEFEGVLALGSAPHTPQATGATAVVAVSNYDEDLHTRGALADGAACGQIVRFLADLGHRHFLHVSGPADYASARNRQQTFLDTTAELGLSGTVVAGNWKGQSGHDAVMALPADTPITAVVAGNDHTALGAMRAAVERGWRIPRDLSVFGWDNHDCGRYSTPSLSTVVNDVERQGREAATRLIALIRGEAPPPPDPRSLHTFLPRESVGPPPARRRRLRPPHA